MKIAEKCYRYIANREDSLDYKEALEKDLPIGSGEIESSHRYVIQKRLKIAGAWWKPETVEYAFLENIESEWRLESILEYSTKGCLSFC